MTARAEDDDVCRIERDNVVQAACTCGAVAATCAGAPFLGAWSEEKRLREKRDLAIWGHPVPSEVI